MPLPAGLGHVESFQSAKASSSRPRVSDSMSSSWSWPVTAIWYRSCPSTVVQPSQVAGVLRNGPSGVTDDVQAPRVIPDRLVPPLRRDGLVDVRSFRVARPTDQREAVRAFYSDALGLADIGSFWFKTLHSLRSPAVSHAAATGTAWSRQYPARSAAETARFQSI